MTLSKGKPSAYFMICRIMQVALYLHGRSAFKKRPGHDLKMVNQERKATNTDET